MPGEWPLIHRTDSRLVQYKIWLPIELDAGKQVFCILREPVDQLPFDQPLNDNGGNSPLQAEQYHQADGKT